MPSFEHANRYAIGCHAGVKRTRDDDFLIGLAGSACFDHLVDHGFHLLRTRRGG